MNGKLVEMHLDFLKQEIVNLKDSYKIEVIKRQSDYKKHMEDIDKLIKADSCLSYALTSLSQKVDMLYEFLKIETIEEPAKKYLRRKK